MKGWPGEPDMDYDVPLPLLPMVSMTSTMVMGRSKTDLSWGRGSSFLLSRIVSSYLAVSRITTETRTVAGHMPSPHVSMAASSLTQCTRPPPP